VSIAIALLLFRLTKLSSQARVVADNERKKQAYSASGVFSDESARQAISEEVNEIIDSRPSRQEAIKKISDVFNRELEKRINLNIQELSRKYETIIKGEKQNEEIAWKKYKRVLSDKQKTEAVIRSIAEGVVVVDTQGKVIMMNSAAEKLLGVSRKDKVGKALLENLKEEQLISLVKGSEDKEEREIELVSPRNETKKVLRASSAVVENENGQTVGMVSVLSDITKQKELDHLKASFVASVSHELRTPLAAIDQSLSLILNKSTGEISPAQEEFLSLAQRNLKRLNILLNDLLDLSKLEAGKMELKRRTVSIEEIAEESIGSLNNWAKAKAIKIVKKIQGGIPQVNVDSNRIIQVLNNLIGNAIKFSPNNADITVEANFQNGKEEIEICVQDTGIGIPKESLTKIFDKFFQLDERTSTDISGTGIGLFVAKEIVELHGGRIWAESEEGRGAKFIFTLPLKNND